MIDAKVHVKCLGGREIVGTLKGYDELVNLVLDDADEFLRGELRVVPIFVVERIGPSQSLLYRRTSHSICNVAFVLDELFS